MSGVNNCGAMISCLPRAKKESGRIWKRKRSNAGNKKILSAWEKGGSLLPAEGLQQGGESGMVSKRALAVNEWGLKAD